MNEGIFRRQARRNGGFTLVELLTVGVIIIILVGIVIAGASYAQRRAANMRTRAEIETISAALEAYKIDTGAYPAGSSIDVVYNALVTATKTNLPLRPDQVSGTSIIDPYGSPYQYTCPGSVNTLSYDLWSYGPDRKGGGSNDVDNITNWQR